MRDMREYFRNIRNIDKDYLLGLLGLETKSTLGDWFVPALGLFSVGFLAGAGLGVILAPKSGREIRRQIRGRFQGIGETVNEVAGKVAERVNETVGSVRRETMGNARREDTFGREV